MYQQGSKTNATCGIFALLLWSSFYPCLVKTLIVFGQSMQGIRFEDEFEHGILLSSNRIVKSTPHYNLSKTLAYLYNVLDVNAISGIHKHISFPLSKLVNVYIQMCVIFHLIRMINSMSNCSFETMTRLIWDTKVK